MQDIIWAAIIGICGALIGSGVTGYVSYRISKLQMEGRNAELEQQLKHQEREARRSRLIETRSNYLNSLREITSKWVIELTRMIDETEILAQRTRTSAQNPFLRTSPDESNAKELQGIEVRLEELREQIEVMRGQVADRKLGDAIDEVLRKQVSVLWDRVSIAAHEWVRPTEGSKHIEKIEEALADIRTVSSALQDDLQLVNKRIEELLVGDEAE